MKPLKQCPHGGTAEELIDEVDRLRARERERRLAHEGTLDDLESVAKLAEAAEARVRELETTLTESNRLLAIESGYAEAAIVAMTRAVKSADLSWCESFLTGRAALKAK